jgi:hypothetical protein
LFLGGALGAIFGLLAFYSSTQIFRSHQTTAAKYLLTEAISGAAFIAYLIFAVILQILIRG